MWKEREKRIESPEILTSKGTRVQSIWAQRQGCTERPVVSAGPACTQCPGTGLSLGLRRRPPADCAGWGRGGGGAWREDRGRRKGSRCAGLSVPADFLSKIYSERCELRASRHLPPTGGSPTSMGPRYVPLWVSEQVPLTSVLHPLLGNV